MKKHLFSFLIFVLIYCLPANEMRVGNGITEMQAAQNYDGTALILYVQNGSLKAINADESSRLQKIDLPDVSGITDVQGLSLSEIDSNYFVCIGKENDICKLITIKVDYENSIELKKYALNLEIESFSNFLLNYDEVKKVYNYTFVNNEVLYNIELTDSEINVIQISNLDDKVTTYKFYYWYEGDLIGYYLSNDDYKITFLKKINNQFTKKDIIFNDKIEYTDLFYTENKDLYVMLFADNKTTLLKEKSENFIEQEITNGYAYYPFLMSNIKISFFDSILNIKRDGLENNYNASEVKIFSANENLIQIIYKDENGWRLLRITDTNIEDLDMNLNPSIRFANYADDQFIIFKDLENNKIVVFSLEICQKIKTIALETLKDVIKIKRNENQKNWTIDDEKFVTLLSDDFELINKMNKDIYIFTKSKKNKSKFCDYYKDVLTVNNVEVIYE